MSDIAVVFPFLVEEIYGQEDGHALGGGYGQPDAVYADKVRQQQYVRHDEYEGADKRDGCRYLPVGVCGKHRGCEDVDTGKDIVE